MPKKELYAKREFLNKGTYHSTASVCGTLQFDEKDDYYPMFANFSLSNCDRTINLDIDTSSIEDIDNSVYKMQMIVDTALGLKKALIKYKPLLERWLEKEKQRKLAEKKKE